MFVHSTGLVYALVASRWIVSLIFVGAGLAKTGDRSELTEVIQRYELVPRRYAEVGASVLPWLEIVLGVALACGLKPAVTGSLASLLLLGFAAAVAVNLARGRRFDCGCGGALRAEIGWPVVIRNVILAVAAASVAVGPVGLSAFTGTLGGDRAHATAQALLAVPLIVISAFAVSRCILSYAEGSFVSKQSPATGQP